MHTHREILQVHRGGNLPVPSNHADIAVAKTGVNCPNAGKAYILFCTGLRANQLISLSPVLHGLPADRLEISMSFVALHVTSHLQNDDHRMRTRWQRDCNLRLCAIGCNKGRNCKSEAMRLSLDWNSGSRTCLNETSSEPFQSLPSDTIWDFIL